MKVCTKCEAMLPSTSFYKGRNDCKACRKKYMDKYRKEKDYNKKYYEQNKQKDKKRCLENYYKNKSDPDKRLKWRENQLRVKYGMTLDDWNLLYESQNYGCAICKSDVPVGNGVLHVDHCHATGKIRGLLCHHCNTGLGAFKDNPDTLSVAIKYLEDSKKFT